MMSKPKDFSASKLLCYRFFCLSAKLKRFISYVALALILVNNTSAVAQAQKLNDNQVQSSSTSPNYVAPRGGVTVNETPSCSNNITFSEYSLDTAITNQYGNKGIVFGGSSPFITTDGANPTSPVLSGSPRFFGAIEGSFVNPKDGVTPAIADSFQLDAGYFDSVGSTALKLYDSEGNLIEQRTNTGEGIFTFTVEGLPVAKWRLEPIGDDPAGFAIDNVCFNLQTVKQSPRQYPEYLKDGDTLEFVPETDFPESERPLPDYFVPSVSPTQNEEDYIELEEPSLQTNQDSTPLSSNAASSNLITPPDPKVVAARSCAGIGTPLTQNDLFQLAKKIKPKATAFEIRDAFEKFAVYSQFLRKYDGEPFKSPERYNKTGYRKRGRLASVIPEAATNSVIIKLAPYKYGPPQIIRYPNSAFWDAKSIREGKKIELKTGEYQAQGYLDYLAHYSAAALANVSKREHPVGNLIYMTTADIAFTSGMLNYQGETPGVPATPVAVFQMVACLKNTNGQPTENYLQIGRGILLNKSRFIGYPPDAFDPLPAGRPGSLKLKP